MVFAVKLLDSLKIDDPVGAVPVHLFNGVFGTICVGLFAVDKITGAATGNGLFNGGGTTLLIAQLQGIVAVAVYTLGSVARVLARSSSSPSGSASARKRKSKASTSASTVRKRTSGLRRLCRRPALAPGSPELSHLTKAETARRGLRRLIWRTP